MSRPKGPSETSMPLDQGLLDLRVYAPLNYGETLRVCGSSLALGLMKHDDGVDLVTSSQAYPVWSCKVPVFANQTIEYRYAVYSGRKFNRWERGEDLRFVVLRKGVGRHFFVLLNAPVQDLAPLPDGTPGTTLTVYDRLDSAGLVYVNHVCNFAYSLGRLAGRGLRQRLRAATSSRRQRLSLSLRRSTRRDVRKIRRIASLLATRNRLATTTLRARSRFSTATS